jgi:hypothetical protein
MTEQGCIIEMLIDFLLDSRGSSSACHGFFFIDKVAETDNNVHKGVD